jgi:hypothetical protein
MREIGPMKTSLGAILSVRRQELADEFYAAALRRLL